jgi:hypothetical protein
VQKELKMKIFLKKLLGQESGYSGDKPNVRGKYILIPKVAWEHFPTLSQGTRNSFCSIRIKEPKGSWLGIIYVWNNTKYFPEVGGRDHDERRLYRNNSVDESLGLDRNVIIGLAQSEKSTTDFYANSCSPGQTEYENLMGLLGQETAIMVDMDVVKSIAPKFSETILYEVNQDISQPESEETSVENAEEIFDDVKKRFVEYLGPKVDVDGDPLLALSSSFKSQGDFTLAVRRIYKGKCALRESFIYKDHPVGLEAAHVHAKVNGGNNLPSNGILLSTDLHRAFDEGIWTLSDDLKVIVHENIRDGLLLEFNNKELAIPTENVAFRPFQGYVKWHRENRFGLFTRLGS